MLTTKSRSIRFALICVALASSSGAFAMPYSHPGPPPDKLCNAYCAGSHQICVRFAAQDYASCLQDCPPGFESIECSSSDCDNVMQESMAYCRDELLECLEAPDACDGSF